MENPENATRKLLELINAFGKVAGYKISKQKYLAFLYTNNGEGNGTPLQYSCLENLRGGGAWWAAVHGVTEEEKRAWVSQGGVKGNFVFYIALF